MRLAAAPVAAMGLLLAALLGAAGEARAEYYCSPGFEPISGGRCVATLSRSEVELYLNDPGYEDAPVRHYRTHRRHHRVRARY